MTKMLLRFLNILLLLMVGIGNVCGANGITGFPYWTAFSEYTEPFSGGTINSTNSNIGSVFVVHNTTATATFAKTYSLKATETVTLSFSAYHGYENNSNKISTFSINNSDGVSLVGYRFNHQTGNITDVIIGGNKVNGDEVNGQSFRSNTEIANGIEGNGRPYIGGEQGVNTPKITMSIYGNGYVLFNIYRSAGSSTVDRTFPGVLAEGIKKDLESIVITNSCTYEDRSIAIDDLYLQSTLFYQNYESDGIMPDWTTSDGGRYTPVILDEGGNHYMSVNQSERNNNGTVLRSTSLQGIVGAGKDFNLSFDLKVSSSTDQSPTSFTIYDVTNTAPIFSLTATGTWATTWKVNGTNTEVTLPGSNSGNSNNDITNVSWISVEIEKNAGTLYVTITNRETNDVILSRSAFYTSNIGGLGNMEFATSRYRANFAIDNVWVFNKESFAIRWSAESATVNIIDVGNTNPNVIEGLPSLSAHTFNISSYGSSNTKVAVYWGGVQIVGVGSTVIYATDTEGNSVGYLLTVTGDRVQAGVSDNTIEFNEVGLIANSQDADGRKNYVLSTGLSVTYGDTGESSVVVNSGMGNVLKIIDANGFSHPNISSPSSPSNPASGAYGGGYIKLEATELGYLIVRGNVSSDRTVIYQANGAALTPEFEDNRMRVELPVGVYYLYNQRLSSDEASSIYVPLVHSISFVHAFFEEAYQVISIPDGGSYPIQNVLGLSNPQYSIIGYEGELNYNRPILSGNNITNITASGAIKIKAESGGNSATYVLTVAYPATPYPGKLWDFNQYYETYQPPLSINEGGGKIGFPRIDANPNGTVDLTNTEGGSANIIDEHGDAWAAELKNVNYGSGRDARWRHVNAVNGDNAFVVSETAGLVFRTGGKGFFVRNDRVKYNCWGHVGIRQNGASFIIPQLKAGDIVEINWKRESGGAGGIFEATNVTDLRGKPVSEQFEMTGSQIGTTGGVMDIYKNPGYTSFIATGGDAIFTLRDGGATDILSIRIYSGGYRTTMRAISGTDHSSPQTTMLLDNDYQEYEYDYCNVLNSTNTGPAIYVLKGYRKGEDEVECVKGTNAGLSPTDFVDDDATYPAYPVSAAESARLYDLRKNLNGFRMYNRTWQSSRNSYNNGRVGASSGWGKVTIRMNNYTNDMKYVIGYTNDVTMTFGSAPHQTYPYTWDFTNISSQAERGKATNAYNTINNYDQYDTNWDNTANGVFSLKTDNWEQFDSQYVPGAVLVTTDRALSPIRYLNTEYALDEFHGLGFSGKISFDSDSKVPSASRSQASTRAASTISLLSFTMDDYKIVNTSEVIDGETVVTSWRNEVNNYLAAGNGWVKFSANKITETNVASCGFAYKCDFNVTDDNKGIFLRPARKLKNGDIITVKIFATSSPSGSNYGICIYPENIYTPSTTLFLGANVKNTEVTFSYIVTVGDGLADQSTIALYRNNGSSVYLTEVSITGDASNEDVRREIFCETATTITIPDLNNGKQDWIYVSASEAPTEVTNVTLVNSVPEGPDANTDHNVFKYKVTSAGNAYLTFAMNTRIYKIGVTHILKGIHSVGGVGWATESREHSIDHELTGYFTVNDVNAYTVKYDSYDMKTATVALTPVIEDGYVAENTGIVLRLDNGSTENGANLTKANSEEALYRVPLFYPSYTRGASSTPTTFSNNYNLMSPNLAEATHQFENAWPSSGGTYTKFILTNTYWTFDKDHTLYKDESATSHTANAAGFYRMHIWKTTSDKDNKNTMAANTAYLLVPSDNLPAAVWTLQEGYSAARGNDILGVYNIVGPGSETAIDDVELTPGVMMNANDVDGDDTWYTVSGMKLSERPTKAGLYIHKNKKVVIK